MPLAGRIVIYLFGAFGYAFIVACGGWRPAIVTAITHALFWSYYLTPMKDWRGANDPLQEKHFHE